MSSGSFNDFIEINGPNGKQTLSVEDGSSGRMQTYWNASRELVPKYQKTGEPAFKMDIPLISDPYYSIQYAVPGLAGSDVPFRNHLSIRQNGCVGVGTMNAQERLEVNGRIKALDLILPLSNTFQLKVAQSDSFHETFEDRSKLLKENRIATIQKGCSTVWFLLNGNYYVGSGSYISLHRNDLQYGLFLTAAHLVVALSPITNTVEKATAMYIVNPLKNEWISVNMNDVYYDGTADIAIIKTGINLSNYPYVLKIAKQEPKIGNYVSVHGNPAGIDNLSVSEGIVRDNHLTEQTGTQTTDCIFITSPGVGGNSGSPILDMYSKIVGIYTFGFKNEETLGGGPNLNTLNHVLPKLVSFPTSGRNTMKKYLGIKYVVATPLELSFYYSDFPIDTYGVVINDIDPIYSPFRDYLEPFDLMRCYINPVNNKKLYFGSFPGQLSPGILCYLYDVPSIKIEVIKFFTMETITYTIPFTTTYNDVPIEKDIPLSGAKADAKIYNPCVRSENIHIVTINKHR